MEENEVVPAEAAEVQAEVPAEEPKVETTPEVAPEVPKEEPPPEPRKKTAQERIDEITKARREAEREREYWKKVALDKEQRPVEPPVDTPQGPPRPTLDQFETTVAYEDALFEWRDKVREIKSAEIAQRTEQEKALRTFNQRASTLRAEYEDFDEVIENPVFSPTMRDVLLVSENGPEVAYFLGKDENRDQAEKIRSMPAPRQAYEIGKLESQLLLAKKTKKVPSAPAPITPVGMGGGVPEKDPSEMDIEEWMAWDRKREQERIRKKYGG